MFEIYKEFHFDAAHKLGGQPGDDPRYSTVHGHSFRAEVHIRGEKGPRGWVTDLGVIDKRVAKLRDRLDHRYLNDIQGLGLPTLENIAEYIWAEMKSIPGLFKVVVRRDSCGEGCIYMGPTPAPVRSKGYLERVEAASA